MDHKSFYVWVVATALVCAAGASTVAAEHPGSDADCASCHSLGKGSDEAPKVMPEPPGFWAKIFGKEAAWGHASVSCIGGTNPDGSVTGCHRPEEGNRHLLTVDIEGRPTDAFCGRCHPAQREDGAHHPTYLTDNDGDGVPETVVRPARPQEVYTTYAPATHSDLVREYPDALVYETRADGTRVRQVALPLETVVEPRQGEERVETDVVTCSTCHNPHYGYLVEAASEEALREELVARSEGDALLRLRDYDNTLCEACH